MTRGTATIIRLAVVALAAIALLGCGSEELLAPTNNIDRAKDEATKAALLTIDTGITAYIAMNQEAPQQVDADSLGSLVSPWPTNPWTNAPMEPGSDPGTFTYQFMGGTSYSLTGHLSDGDFTRP
ncbi:MAG: hypothetical protein R2826_06925 [Thermoleophilia bacterium]